MSKVIFITLGIIALAVGGAFWLWQNRENLEGSTVFINEKPPFPQETTVLPLPVPDSSVEALQAEISKLEAEKEAVVVPTPAKAKPDPASAPSITNRLITWGHAKKNSRTIDTIVLHSSYNSLGGDEYSVEKIIQIYKDYEVGAHYIIDRKGKIYRLVNDKDVAYHAGASKMPDGRTNVNDFSLGFEMINNEEDKYTSAQYEALNDLIDYLENTYSIKHVVGHSDIAPGRKTDPWNFDWKKLK